MIPAGSTAGTTGEELSGSVAIVGIGAIFPDSPDVDQFWNIIAGAVSTAREVPPGRWLLPAEHAFDPAVGKADKVYSRTGCFIDTPLASLDLHGLAIEPALLGSLDPLYHLLLHAGNRAFRDAVTSRLDKARVGVIIGNLALPSEHASAFSRQVLGQTLAEKVLGEKASTNAPTIFPFDRHVTGLPAGLLAGALGLGGTCATLDAACASSLYAVKLAMDELLSGRADAMLTGGLSRPDPLYTQMGFSQLRALSPSGICSPFDARGDGLVVGEGAGILVLKRVSDALRDGDRIYGVIRGIGLANDVGGSLLAPSTEGQLRAMRLAYSQAGWVPSDVDLIECHATGTPVGDAVEFTSLSSLWKDEKWRPGQCVLGSVKSNIGHTLTAAGSAALIKTLLALRHDTLPPTAGFASAAPGIDLDAGPFRVLKTGEKWERRHPGRPRRSAVSAFGFGGINAHLLIEEWVEEPREAFGTTLPPFGKEDPNCGPKGPGGISPAGETNPPRSPFAKGGGEKIAIVGLDARFGPWQGLKKFQCRVLGGGSELPPSTPARWWGVDKSVWFRTGFGSENFAGWYIDEVVVPANEFRIPPKEMEEMLPQQALMLQSAAAALADAGLGREEDLRAGVFIGLGLDMNTTNFTLRWSIPEKAREWAEQLGLDLSAEEMAEWVGTLRESAGAPLTANRTMGALGSVAASRIAREFRIGGPAFTISGEENSGIRALEAAVRALQKGELDRALAGAVDLAGDVRALLATASTNRSSDPARPKEHIHIHPAGEGAVALVLKRLDDAKRDGNRIYGVILGIGAATEPVGVATESFAGHAAMACAYEEAAVSPTSIGFLEMAGVQADDAAEVAMPALLVSETEDATRHQRPVLGRADSVIGHSGAAAGLASVARAALCLYQQILPPSIPLNSGEERDKALFHQAATPRYWLHNRASGPRRAAVNCRGTDGSCNYIILEEADFVSQATDAERHQPLGAPEEGLFSVAGDSPRALIEAADRLQKFVMEGVGKGIDLLARQWQRLQPADWAMPLALALVARNRGELLDQLDFARTSIAEAPDRRIGNGDAPIPPFVRDRVFYSPNPLGSDAKIAFVFPGSGNHYPDMGRELSCRWPEVFRAQDGNNLFLRDQFQPDLFWDDCDLVGTNTDHKAMIFGQVALGTAVSDVVRRFGVEPKAAIGYSLGESAALFSLGAWRDRDLMLQRMNESTLFTHDMAGECRAARQMWGLGDDEPVEWTLGVVDRPADAVRQALAPLRQVYLLIVNTPDECVVGGNRPAVERLVEQLDCRFFPLSGVTTVHCEVAQPVAQPYHALHLFPATPPDVTFYSGAWGESFAVTTESAAEAILAQALEGIDYPKVIEAAYRDSVRIFLEMGPGASCSRMIAGILQGRPHVARSACFPGHDPVSTMLRLLGQLIAERVPVDLVPLYGAETGGAVKEHTPGQVVRLMVGCEPFRAELPPKLPCCPPSVPSPVDAGDTRPRHGIREAGNGPDCGGTPPCEGGGWSAESIISARDAVVRAHDAYLRFSAGITETMTKNLEWQMSLIKAAQASGDPDVIFPADIPLQMPPPAAFRPEVAFDRPLCMEFAVGSVAAMLGPEFAEADTFPTRVRLPDEPLMLVDRIVSVEGEPRSMTSGRVVTEHDVLPGAWYLDGGRIPTCIAVEAGQADLFLSGYLGIDFITRGLAVYRLLDAVVTFHRALPRPGETINYDIRIERFFRQDRTYLFRFSFEGTVNGEPLLSMRDGCAGFFTEQELAAGKGIVHTKLDLLPKPGLKPADWREPVPMEVEEYDAAGLDALRRGDLAACFGPRFANLPVRRPLTIPGGRMKLVDRVVNVDPAGGRFGLGRIRAEADIDPAIWFLTCHFVDDRVMPGTLMYECCMHTLRIYLLRMGWVGEADETVCEPVPGVASQLKCRGQVVETTRTVTYEVSLKEVGYRPEPYVICDALMYADGKPVVEITNMSARLSGLTREKVEGLWNERGEGEGTSKRPAIFDYDRILAFAVGNPSEAFGEPYRVFDSERTIARLPGPPFQFLDRIVDIDAEPWKMKAGGAVTAEYDVPEDAWYFAANRSRLMPFSVLLEVALQPCGWLAAYIGSALTSPMDLRFRNLGGNAVQFLPVTPETGTLTTSVKITQVASSGGMIIQNYELQVESSAGIVYKGDTVFGFFSAEALAQQVGIREALPWRPSAGEAFEAHRLPYPEQAPFPDTMLRMVDRIDCFLPAGGSASLGYIRGVKKVNPEEWFFKAHFYQDPVCPGSLGLESFLQLLKVAATWRWGEGADVRFETVALNRKHTWTYRGQVTPGNGEVTIEAVITASDDVKRILTADGFLSVDGKIIYQMEGFTVRMG